MDNESTATDAGKARRLLDKTPWWTLSILFHASLLVVLWRVAFRIDKSDKSNKDVLITIEVPKEHQNMESTPPRPMENRRSPIDTTETTDLLPKIEGIETEDDTLLIEDPGNITDTDLAETEPCGSSITELGIAAIQGWIFAPGDGTNGSGGKGKDPWGRDPGNGWPRGVPRPPANWTDAVTAGLLWLMRHQSDDGAWHPDKWSAECPHGDCCIGHGEGTLNDTGKSRPAAVTAMALLAYLANGHTHMSGDFRMTVRDGMKYLRSIQSPDGRFRAPGKCDMYDHGIAALAMVEAYAMTRDDNYRDCAQRAVDYICSVQNPLGGWNYESPNIRNDMSVSGWQIMALKSAKIGGMQVPDKTIKRAVRWLDIATDEETGSVAYAIEANDPNAEYPGGGGSIRMRAAGAMGHLFFGKPPKDPVLQKDGDFFLKNLPAWQPGNGEDASDLYYWYYASLVSYQLQGKHWKDWSNALQESLVKNQINEETHARGSWAPIGRYSEEWPRPGATALGVLCLQVCRYGLLKR